MGIFGRRRDRLKGVLRPSFKIPQEMAPIVLDNITDGILLLSRDGRILLANKRILDMTRLSRNEIIGDFCYRVTHHRDRPCRPPYAVCPVERVLETGEVAHVVHTHFDKDGAEIHVEVSAYPVRDKKGEIAQFVHITRDVTERINAEKALAAAKDYVDNIIKSIMDILVVVDLSARIVVVNKAVCDLLDCEEYELLGRKIDRVFPEEEVFGGIGRLRRLLEEGVEDVIRDREIRYHTKEGEPVFMLLSGSVMRDKNGRPIGMVIIARDITSHKKMQEVLGEKTELEQFKEMAVDREIQMLELKKQINRLSQELGRAAPYDVSG